MKQLTITEQAISLIGRRLNGKKDLKEMQTVYDLAIEEGIAVTDEQAHKGFAWLMDQYKSPTGKIRVSNPYGAREIEALESGVKAFTYDGHFNAGNLYVDFYTPLYTFIGNNGITFQYYVSGGTINIIG